jgi:hypothetical protein
VSDFEKEVKRIEKRKDAKPKGGGQ